MYVHKSAFKTNYITKACIKISNKMKNDETLFDDD